MGQLLQGYGRWCHRARPRQKGTQHGSVTKAVELGDARVLLQVAGKSSSTLNASAEVWRAMHMLADSHCVARWANRKKLESAV